MSRGSTFLVSVSGVRRPYARVEADCRCLRIRTTSSTKDAHDELGDIIVQESPGRLQGFPQRIIGVAGREVERLQLQEERPRLCVVGRQLQVPVELLGIPVEVEADTQVFAQRL